MAHEALLRATASATFTPEELQTRLDQQQQTLTELVAWLDTHRPQAH